MPNSMVFKIIIFLFGTHKAAFVPYTFEREKHKVVVQTSQECISYRHDFKLHMGHTPVKTRCVSIDN